MTISETDLKLLKAERMTDYNDGGGLMTAAEVFDGQANNLFNDISQLDRTYGRVAMRKTFASIRTNNADTYLGAHIIVTDPPDDPNVNVTLFSTESWTDERAAARDRIESYSIKGPQSRWVLFGDHIVGQKQLQLFSLSNAASLISPSPDPSPEVGDVYMLNVEANGYTPNYQYVRITKLVSRVTQMFTDGGGVFYKDVAIVEIGNPLRYTFYGATVTRLSAHGSPTIVRSTSVADAAEYYGVKKVTQQLSIGDVVVQVGSPYAALVPSAQSESPMVDVSAGMTKANFKQAGAAGGLTQSATLGGSVAPDYADDLFIGRGFLPGSLSLTIGGVAYKDDAAGNLLLSTGVAGTYGGTCDYTNGHIRITKGSSWSNVAVSATATQAVAIYDNSCTLSIPITLNNRAFNYVKTLPTAPTPTTLTVDYKALDKWYRMTDDGSGHLTSAQGSSVGSGTIDYATGSAIVTLGALPDVDSAVIFSWATPLDYTMQYGVLTPPPPRLKMTLANTPVKPGTLVITWTDSGSKTASANAAGIITGDATGRIVNGTGELEFSPNSIPPTDTIFHIAYDQDGGTLETITTTASGGVVTITLGNTNLRAGSVMFEYPLKLTGMDTYIISTVDPSGTLTGGTVTRRVFDNGTGGLVDEAGNVISGATINYTTGQVTFNAQVCTYGYRRAYRYRCPYQFGYWGKPYLQYVNVVGTFQASTGIVTKYALDSASPVSKTEDITLSDLTIDLTTVTASDIAAGSVKFTFAGATYIDRAGAVYRAHDNLTDSATHAGEINYQTGIVTLTDWTAGANSLTLSGMVTSNGGQATPSVFFRTPGAPLATGQFQINAVTVWGESITASANNNGDIASEWITGHVDWLSGVVSINFGKKMLDASLPASLKAADWYNAADIDNAGYIWVPLLVKPETMFFNTVLVSYIPLDGDILGVDTVRLPLDGRVPIYRNGNVAVLHHTETLTLDDPVTLNTPINLGRTLLSYAKVFDATGAIVPTNQYTKDLDAGTVTITSVSGLTQPLKVEFRIEDMSLITDVQITGAVTLMKPVRHAYPANTTYLSSALVIGDMQARVANVFEQSTWASVWADTRSGGAPSAQYNDVLYPIEVSNVGAIEERWAIVFNNSTSFNVYGEYSGLIATGSVNADLSPDNPASHATIYETLPNPVVAGATYNLGNGNIAFLEMYDQNGSIVPGSQYTLDAVNGSVTMANPLSVGAFLQPLRVAYRISTGGFPYFRVRAAGWGAGWAAGNCLRFNTVAANYPMWLARTTLQSDPAVYTDNFKIQIRGDAN